MANVAFIGTGGMGQGMAYNLLKARHDLTVCNRTVSKTAPLVDAGATLALSPKQAVTHADVIIVMVGDDQASQEVWLGPDGVLAGQPKRGALAIESTTLSLDWVRELAAALKDAGLRFLDCPVTGGRQGALAGTLTLLVGASEDDLAAARPVLDAYSQAIVHFGAPGSGTAYKLVVNLMVGVQTAALAEGLLLAQRAGLDMDQVIQGLTSGAVASPIVRAYAGKMVRGEHEPVTNFLARWMEKDMLYALRLAATVGQPVPTSAVAAQVFQLARARGLIDKNGTAVMEALR
jgi:3-hydroxyisobutyrate dehydrogenase